MSGASHQNNPSGSLFCQWEGVWETGEACRGKRATMRHTASKSSQGPTPGVPAVGTKAAILSEGISLIPVPEASTSRLVKGGEMGAIQRRTPFRPDGTNLTHGD